MRFLLPLLLLTAAPVAARAQDLGISVGTKAPAAVVEALDGSSVDIGRYIGKTPVLIEFWATWCGNCRELEPALVAAQKKYSGRVKFVGVAVSVNESPERVRLYARKHGLAHEVLYDRRGTATDAYDVPATSYVVVIDAKGTVVYTGLGGTQDLEAAIRKAL